MTKTLAETSYARLCRGKLDLYGVVMRETSASLGLRAIMGPILCQRP